MDGGKAAAGVSPAPSRAASNPVRPTVLGCGVLVALVVILGGWMLKQSYDSEVNEASMSVGNQAVILGENVRQVIASADAFLSTAAAQLKFDAAGNLQDPEEVRSLLAAWAEKLPLVASFSFASADGRRIIDTRYPGLGEGPTVEKTQSYAFARDDRSLKLGIVGPGRTAVGDRPFVISLVRRVEDKDHRFLGLLVEVFTVDALAQYFAQITVGKTGAITLFRMIDSDSAGIVLTRYPTDAEMIGTTIQRSDPRVRWLTRTSEYEIARTSFAGTERLVGLRTIPEYALSVTLARPWADVMTPWHSRAVLIVLSMTVVILVLVGTAAALIRQVNARIALERRAAAALAERRLVELEVQTSKLDSMARLSGGLAHELNNQLQPLKTLSELGRQMAEATDMPRERLAHYFARIHATTSLASSIAADFLTFCGSHTRPIARRNLTVAVHAALNNVLLPDGTTLELKLAPDLHARFDDIGMAQILANLVKNAIEAAAAEPPAAPLKITVALTRAANGDAVLRVSDNGPGMSEAVRARAFEPFFTTKSGSGGTGLGLAVIYGIVTAWQGRIEIESQPGAGPSVTITVPAGDARDLEVANEPRRSTA